MTDLRVTVVLLILLAAWQPASASRLPKSEHHSHNTSCTWENSGETRNLTELISKKEDLSARVWICFFNWTVTKSMIMFFDNRPVNTLPHLVKPLSRFAEVSHFWRTPQCQPYCGLYTEEKISLDLAYHGDQSSIVPNITPVTVLILCSLWHSVPTFHRASVRCCIFFKHPCVAVFFFFVFFFYIRLVFSLTSQPHTNLVL